MRFGWGLLALLLLLGSQAAAQTVTPDTSSVQGQFYTTFVIGGGGPGLSQPTGLLISSAQLPALGTTDLGANAHLISDGWSADVTLHATTDASPTYAHYAGLYQPSYATPLAGVLPTPTSNFMHFTDTRPGFVCTAGLGANCASTTFATTVYGTVPLRQPFGVGGSNTSQNNPITGTSGADLIVSLALSDPVFSGDTVGQATFASGFYNYDGAHPSPAAHVTPTTGTLPNYPFPIMSWVTPPGQYFSSAVGYTVEVNCVAGSYGSTQTSQPAMCAGVTVTASDGTHTVTRTALTMTASALQVSATGTATNGSNCITSMGSTDGFNVGDRVTVYGVPGFPKVLSKTSSQVCLGINTTATFTTGSPGTITLLAPTNGDGNAFAEGAFVGASISGANINAGVSAATIQNASGSTWAFNAAKLTYSGANPKFATAAVLTTGATATTSGTAQAVIILENYLGSNGTVTVYKGVPHYDYSVNFPASDFSGTLTTAGNISFEAKGYPQYGNHVTDSALGAGAMNVPGTTADGCDWFAVNIGSCSGAAIFAAAGTDASPNFHNLWSNDDSSYSPLFCFVASTGTGTTAAATCSTSPTAPASGCTTTCAAGPFVTLASVKSYNNNGANRTNVHNDLNGVVYCYISTGSPVTYSGWGGSIFASITVKKPGTVMTSVKSAGTCPTYGVAGSDPVNINFDYSGTAANNQLAGTEYVDNISFTTSNAPIWGPDIAVSSAFPAAEDIFNNDIFTPGAAAPTIQRVGVSHFLNDQINQGLFNGNILSPSGTNTNSPGEVAFSTLVLAKYNAASAVSWWGFNDFGNVSFGNGPITPLPTASATSYAQPLSVSLLDNAFLNYGGSGILQQTGPVPQMLNYALVNNVCEYVDALSACFWLSGDSADGPTYNTLSVYNTDVGGRFNHHYEEGEPTASGTAAATGGSLAGTTVYHYGIVYTNPGGTTADMFDGSSAVTTPACATVCSISLKVAPLTLPGNPEGGVRKAFIYLNTTDFAGVSSATEATVTGCATQPCTIGPAGTTFVLTAVSGTSDALPVLSGSFVLPAPWCGVAPMKLREVDHFNLDALNASKNDTYSFNGSSSTTTWGSGCRLGNWDWQNGVSGIGYATQLGNGIQGVGSGTGPEGSTGMYSGWLSQPSANGYASANYSNFAYVDDRSCGNSGTAVTCGGIPGSSTTQYGTNLGAGDYCLKHTSPAGLALVPSGYAEWPIDLYGVARHNDGTGTAGAIEGNDTGAAGAAVCF